MRIALSLLLRISLPVGLPTGLAAALAAALGACSASQIPSLKDYADSVVGRDVAVVRDLVRRPGSYASTVGWQERTYTLPNGHWVYVEPDRANCEIHYEVDGADIIVGYTPVGTGCRYQ